MRLVLNNNTLLIITIRFTLMHLVFLSGIFSPHAFSQNIATIGGNGNFDSQGDGSPAVCAGLMGPTGVAVDANGNVFIASQHSIRKISSSTLFISAYSGTSNPGSMNDGYPANSGLLHDPVSICFDQQGNLYIAEKYWHRIRKINIVTGIITTVAGTGIAGFSGDGGPGTAAMLNTPVDVKSDNNGNLLIADYENFRIRKLNLASGIINTIAGNGSSFYSGDGGPATNAGLALPVSVCGDPAGNVYLSEARPGNSSRIRKINSFGVITTIAGSGAFTSTGDGGLAINATMMSPSGLAIDFQGNIFFTDAEAARIRKITTSTGIITTIAGNGTNGFSGDGSAATSARLMIPRGIWLDNAGNVLFADFGNNRIRKIYMNPASPPPGPQLSISATSVSTCNGTPIMFTAAVYNGTPNMTYQWYRNANPVGSNNYVYVPSSSLNAGDVITCIVTATSCIGTITLNSNSLTIIGPVTPTITISASATTVCPGTTVQYTATAANAGANPVYQWKVNSLPVGSNSPVYTRVVTTSGENITCELTPDPSLPCAGTQIIYSNQIGMTVTYGIAGQISIAASGNDICPGTPVTFTASVQFAGNAPSYQWQVNGTAVGNNQATFTTSSLKDQDAVHCILTSVNNSCQPAPVPSAPVIIHVKPAPQIQVIPADTLVAYGAQVPLRATINGPYTSYQWLPSSQLINSNSLSPVTSPSTINTKYVLEVTTAEGCRVTATSIVNIYSRLLMPNAFTPNGDGVNDIFRIPPGASITLVSFFIFDRWGKRVFMTKDPSKGWNGTLNGNKMPGGTYVYFVEAIDKNEKIQVRGTCTLIR